MLGVFLDRIVLPECVEDVPYSPINLVKAGYSLRMLFVTENQEVGSEFMCQKIGYCS